MFKKFSFWIWGTIVLQFLTAALHSLSFFMAPGPKNETEKQLADLTTNYKPDAGMGFNPSFMDLFTGLSISFTLICLFGALLNWYLVREKITHQLWKGILLIETSIFGSLCLAMVVCTALIFIFVSAAFLTLKER